MHKFDGWTTSPDCEQIRQGHLQGSGVAKGLNLMGRSKPDSNAKAKDVNTDSPDEYDPDSHIKHACWGFHIAGMAVILLLVLFFVLSLFLR